MESEPRRQCFVGGCSVDRWLFGHLCQATGDNERNRAVLAKELQAGSYKRVVVRSDGEPALLVHVIAARAMTVVADVPVESVREQVSKEQSPGNGLAEGAVEELKAKIRSLRHSTKTGLGRQIPETHDSLAWLVTHAAATINWFRPGARREDAVRAACGPQVSQTNGSMRAEGLVDECKEARSAESRWQEGIFLGILGGGVGASDYATGTPDGVQTARAIKLVPESDAWDIEWLLAVKRTSLGSSAGRPWSEDSSPGSRGAARARLAAGAQSEASLHQTRCGNSQVRSDDWVPGVHGHHTENDRSGASTRVPGQDRAEDARRHHIRRKRSRPDDEGGRPDVEMEGGSKASRSIWWFQFVLGGETRALAAQGR